MSPFQQKSVLITGAGRGIGKRFAVGFAAAGARLGLLARSRTELQLVQLEIEHSGGLPAEIFTADVREYPLLTSSVARFTGIGGAVDILVCAHAAWGAIGPLAACEPADWAQAVSTNLLGALHACRAVLPGMISRRRGKIILLTGPGADSARPNFSAYASTQAALARLAETLAEEVRAHNVQVNCLQPGPTYTSLTDELLAAGDLAGPRETRDALLLRTNGGTPADRQWELLEFLASERSNHISGRLLSVSDSWKRLERNEPPADAFTLRRSQRG